MDFLIVIIALICAAVSGLFSSVQQFQMLQQNSYYPSRYIKWVKESFSVQVAIYAVIFCACSVLFTYGFFPIMAIILACLCGWNITSAFMVQKTSIKKLVFTARVKRLFAAEIIILAALILAYAFTPDYSMIGDICLVAAIMFSVVSPILTLLAWLITCPVEKAFSKYYINDAKKILAEHKDLTVIGITGSYGKTTTKFILNRILSEKYNTVCTPQSFNTPMGVVRTVREKIKPQTQMFVCEMGAKNRGDIKEICDIAHPTFGIITSVGSQHLDTFKTVLNVFRTKFELAAAVKSAGGKCIVNADSEEISSRIDALDDVIPFGNGTAYYAQNIRYSSDGSRFDLILDGEKTAVSTRLLGKHCVSDIVAAAAMAHILGVEAQDIAYAVSTLKATEHRLELKSFNNGSLMIDDAYNSNPEGCLEAVHVLKSFQGFKKVIVTPGLIELGDKEYESNYSLGLEAANYCDIIILVGQNRSKPLKDAIDTTEFNQDNLYIVSSFKEAMEIYTPMADEKSIVLLENDLPDNYLN